MSDLALEPVNSKKAPGGSMRRWMVVAPLAVALLAPAGYWYFSRPTVQGTAAVGQMFFTVAPSEMIVRISKDGEVHAVNNIDITNTVEGQTTIQTVIKEGTSVKKGEVLATLDSSSIRQRIEDTTLELQKAEADLTNATEMKEIQISQNAANLSATETELTLAALDLRQYVEGSYPQQLKAAESTLEIAKITLDNAQQEFEQARSLAAKGFVTPTDVKKSELAVNNAIRDLDKTQTALTVLTDYTHEADLAAKSNAKAQADRRLARVKRENAANLSQKEADVDARTQGLGVLRRRMVRLEEQLAACTITAPADGIVVYNNQNDQQIREGASARERQVLLRLPDTASMKAVVRIIESQVSKLDLGQEAVVTIVGQPESVKAKLTKISVLADSSNRWWNPDLKEYPVDLDLDQTPRGLKPGVGCSVEIMIDRIVDAMAVPIGAVYTMDSVTYVFVKVGDRVVPRSVTLGTSNETHVVVDGVMSGEQLLMLQSGQGKRLLEDAGIRSAGPANGPTTAPTTAPTAAAR